MRFFLWMMGFRREAVDVLLAIAGAFFIAAFSRVVPFNMDEFIHYNTLICALYPLSNLGGDSCGSMGLFLPGTEWLVPLRAFHYSGSAPALYYLPLLLLWPSPLSARFLGLIFLWAEAYFLSRVMGMRIWLPLLGLLAFFPYAFQQIVDTGPVAFHMMSIFALYVLFGRWARTLRPAPMVAAMFLIAFCIWIKFSYFWLLPGIGMLWLVQVLRHHAWRTSMREVVLQTAAAFALAALPLIIVISSVSPTNPAEHPYLDQLRTSEAYTVSEMTTIEWPRTSIGQAFLKPMEASQRIFLVHPMPVMLDVIFQLLTFCFTPFVVLVVLLMRRRAGTWIPLLLYVAFLSAVFMILRTKASAAVHHAILAYPFLVLSIGEAIRLLREVPERSGRFVRAGLWLWFAAFLVVNITYWSAMPKQPTHLTADASKDTLMQVLRDPEVAQRYIIVAADWGVYYIQGLYGDPQQILTWKWGILPEEFTALRELAASKQRKLLFMHSQPETESDIPMLRTVATQSCDAVPPNARWQIIAEPDPALTTACNRVGGAVK